MENFDDPKRDDALQAKFLHVMVGKPRAFILSTQENLLETKLEMRLERFQNSGYHLFRIFSGCMGTETFQLWHIST